MKKIIALILVAVLLIPTLVIAPFFPVHTHAATVYAICVICDGSGKCGLCDPKNTPEGHGDGWLDCGFCDENGMRKCGTNHTGDGTPIGCDGSGYMPDGSVCWNCNGTGVYLCDACHGEKKFKCKCLEMGQPGKCTVCYGTGWYTVDSQGQKIELGHGVYPPDGAKLDAGAWGRHEYYTYNASRFGTNVTPYQAMAKYGASTREQFYKVLGGGTISGSGSGGSGSGGNSGGNNSGNNSGNNGGNSGGNGGGDNSGDNGGSGQEPDNEGEPTQTDFYEGEVVSDEETVRRFADEGYEMIHLLSMRVDGDRLFTVQVVKRYLSQTERNKLDSMTAADIGALKEELKGKGHGFRYITGGPIQVSGGDYCRDFNFSGDYELPFTCDVLLQLPEGDKPENYKLYLAEGEGYREINCTVDQDGSVRYLIFTTNKLGDFTLTNGTPTGVAPRPDATDGDVDEASSAAEDPGSAPRESGGNNLMPIILIALGAAAAGAASVAIPMAIKKRKGA